MKSLRMFYVGPDEYAVSNNEAAEIMASSHYEAMEKGLALHAQGLLIKSDFVAVELFVTDGHTSQTFEFEPSPIDCPDWIERTEYPMDHPELWPLIQQLQHNEHWNDCHPETTATDSAEWLPKLTIAL